jgi:hypothetical protein
MSQRQHDALSQSQSRIERDNAFTCFGAKIVIGTTMLSFEVLVSRKTKKRAHAIVATTGCENVLLHCISFQQLVLLRIKYCTVDRSRHV